MDLKLRYYLIRPFALFQFRCRITLFFDNVSIYYGQGCFSNKSFSHRQSWPLIMRQMGKIGILLRKVSPLNANMSRTNKDMTLRFSPLKSPRNSLQMFFRL